MKIELFLHGMIFITYIVCVWSIVAPSVVELDFLVKLLHDQRLKTLYLQLIWS